MVVVSIVNVQALIVPVVALLAACSTLAPPISGQPPDPKFYASQMKRLKEELTAASAILVSGILHMGAWLRWTASPVADKAGQKAVAWDSSRHHVVLGCHVYVDAGGDLPACGPRPREANRGAVARPSC